MPPSASTATPSTSRSDERVLRVLDEIGISPTQRESLISTWHDQRTAVESFAEFLVRLGVFDSPAPQLLAMNWGDELLLSGCDDLFQADGISTLQKLVGPITIARQTPGMAEITETFVVQKKPLVIPPTTTSRSESADLPSGHLLGRCVVSGRLAHGSYGVVYQATHQTLNIPVAIKVLHPDLLRAESRAAAQFRSEAMLLARLNHPNIVRVWDFDDSVKPPYLVLEFVDGANVAELIQRDGSVPMEVALRIVRQVVDGLAAAFQHGIVHRDVKPANILLTQDGNSKIADLGLAVCADRSRDLSHLAPSATNPKAMMGTVAYLAPEQAGGPGTIDHRSDIYSLGATFYHMVTGQLPFLGHSALEVLMKHSRQPVTPPHEILPGFDRGVSDLIVRMMAKSPHDRYATYDHLRTALANLDPRPLPQSPALVDTLVCTPPPAITKSGLFRWLGWK